MFDLLDFLHQAYAGYVDSSLKPKGCTYVDPNEGNTPQRVCADYPRASHTRLAQMHCELSCPHEPR